jgi:hypothetical protein
MSKMTTPVTSRMSTPAVSGRYNAKKLKPTKQVEFVEELDLGPEETINQRTTSLNPK